MGGSGNWLKSLVAHKKSVPDDQVSGRKNTKWKIWRGSSSSDIGLPKPSDCAVSAMNDVYSAAMATLIRAPPKNFLIVRKEWAAIRIQTAFRALLARRALRALKALVRLQAIVRGRLVRKQAAMTLKCMQALVRVQAQIKARNVRVSLQGKSLQRKLENEAEQLRVNRDLNKLDKSSYASSWPWEEADLDFSLDSVTSSASSTEHKTGRTSSNAELKASDSFDSFDHDTSRVAQNNTAKRVAATRPHMSSKGYINESSSSSSSSVATEGADESAGVGCSKPLYMSPRGSRRRANQRGVSKSQQREALYSPAKSDRYDWTRCH